MNEKRNSIEKKQDPDQARDGAAGTGGGSAEQGAALPAGAGYLATCRDPADQKKIGAEKSPAAIPDSDEWLLQLQACGINQGLLRVARRVGFEIFMEIWAELDRDDSVLDERRRLHIPHMDKTLLRYQRARIIRAMGEKGMKAADILQALPPRLRGHLSRRTVVRIITGK